MLTKMTLGRHFNTFVKFGAVGLLTSALYALILILYTDHLGFFPYGTHTVTESSIKT